jgi:acetyl esterase/lipase
MQSKIAHLMLFIGISYFLSACSSIKFHVVNLPSHFSEHQISTDIAFSALSPDLQLDVYSPQNVDNAPVVVFFYGGSWKFGKKEQYAFVGDYFASHGFVTVIADYRKYPQVKFPDFIKDGAEAINWTQQSIKEYGGDPNRISIVGHSAGAHIGALLVSDPRYLPQFPQHSPINAFVGLSGPYHFTPKEPDFKDMFGPPENYANMQVSTFIDGNEPPMLLVYGESDKVVGDINLIRLRSALDKHNNAYTVKTFPDAGHADTVATFSWIYKNRLDIDNEVIEFLKAQAAIYKP